MSAFIVSKAHIDALVSAANAWCMTYRSGRPTNSDLGAMLWTENLNSVAYRYPRDASGERPGPSGLVDEDIANYQWLPTFPTLEPVQAIKAAHCLEYQSCEHPQWDGSPAATFLREFVREAIRRLPGYEGAPWGID